ncbi:MAG: putative colanic acid biosynthesis acetyltransferase [Anaerolineae bacterium]|nr:putative colanic acid biosynthesis acetyltransferase [Anaerolineae bacterium]
MTFHFELQNVRTPFSLANRIARLLWWVVSALLFKPTPRNFGAWRRFLLRCFGANLGRKAQVYSGAKIWAPWNLQMGDFSCLDDDVDCYNAGRVCIGKNVIVSRGASLCTATHDHTDPAFPSVTHPITIGDNAWIAARAFVFPGITIGARAVVGACAVVTHDVPPDAIVAGNPAKSIAYREIDSGETDQGL